MYSTGFSAAPQQNGRHIAMITLESSNVKANALTTNTRTVQMMLVSNINVELKTINAIQQLDQSPLLRPILRPRDFPICRMNVNAMPFEYVGHVSQMALYSRRALH